MSDNPELPEEIRKKLLEGDRDAASSGALSDDQLDQVAAGATVDDGSLGGSPTNAVSSPRLRGFGLGGKLP
jgi:hypothetical protein